MHSFISSPSRVVKIQLLYSCISKNYYYTLPIPQHCIPLFYTVTGIRLFESNVLLPKMNVKCNFWLRVLLGCCSLLNRSVNWGDKKELFLENKIKTYVKMKFMKCCVHKLECLYCADVTEDQFVDILSASDGKEGEACIYHHYGGWKPFSWPLWNMLW